ncbi:MAG: phosphate ABC transporter permease subunit PstC [Verrucomicrobiota bacterium]|jgi:phosphate ABC transporter permease protein PstC|nr:phosphate ABC transporter permease subunit PstC [Verrucomicrobiota bacterium]
MTAKIRTNTRHTSLTQGAAQQFLNRVLTRLGVTALAATAGISIVAVAFIFIFILHDAVPFFTTEGARAFFFGTRWYPSATPPQFGAFPIFIGTLYVVILSSLIAIPLGICTATAISEMLGRRMREAVKSTVEILAAIPSVAFGFFALVVVAPWMQAHGAASGANALNVSLVLAMMSLPTIVSLSEDALRTVPREMREGSYALGATRAETVWRVVLPAARSGMCSACLLGVMRAMGETMVVWMASGNSARLPEPWYNVLSPVRTLTATIAGDMGEADHATGSAHYTVLFAMALSLLIFSFLLNAASGWAIRHNPASGGKGGKA